MKFQAVFTLAAAAMIGSVSAADCTTAQQTAAFTALASLLSGSDLTNCAQTSGYNMLYATSTPDDAQKVKMCATPTCHSLIATVISKNPPNCVLLIPTSNAKMNVYELATTFESDCTRLAGTPAPAAATPAPAAATPAPAAGTPSTPAPAAGTPAPAAGTPSVTPKPAC